MNGVMVFEPGHVVVDRNAGSLRQQRQGARLVHTLHGNDFEVTIDDDKDDVCVCACDFKTPGELAHTADCGQGKEESWWIKVNITNMEASFNPLHQQKIFTWR